MIRRKGSFPRPKPLSALDPRYIAARKERTLGPRDYVDAVNQTESLPGDELIDLVFSARSDVVDRFDREVGEALRRGLERRETERARKERLS